MSPQASPRQAGIRIVELIGIMRELLIYTLRPNNTALWIPVDLATAVKLERGMRMPLEQYGSAQVQPLIEGRRRTDDATRKNAY